VSATDIEEIEAWLGLQLRSRLPEAEVLGHESRNGNLYFWMRSHLGDLWLILGQRAHRTLDSHELKTFLESELWLDKILAERCLRVQVSGLHLALCRPPALLV